MTAAPSLPGQPAPAACLRHNRKVTRDMVQARTRELAVLAGRSSLQVTQDDYEQARRELTGETDMARQEARLDAQTDPALAAGPTGAVALADWENEGGQLGRAPSPGPGTIRTPGRRAGDRS